MTELNKSSIPQFRREGGNYIERENVMIPDNEIRVICSEIDREIIHENLSQIFTDTIYTPEPEPYYFLKFSDPSTYKSMKAHANLIVAYANENDKNPGYELVKKILNNEQFEFISKY